MLRESSLQGNPLACRPAMIPTVLAIPSAHVGMFDSPLDAALRSEEQFVFGVCFSLLAAVQTCYPWQLTGLEKTLNDSDWGSDTSGLDISLISMPYSVVSQSWPALLGACRPGCFRQLCTLSPTPCRETLTLSPISPEAIRTQRCIYTHILFRHQGHREDRVERKKGQGEPSFFSRSWNPA